MKTFAIVALSAFVAAPLLPAQSIGTPAAKETVTDPVAKLKAIIKRTNKITAGINDKATAEAAVPALKKCRERIAAMQPELEKALSNMSPEQGMEFFLTLAAMAADAKEDADRIRANDYYGCAALKALMSESENIEINASGAPVGMPQID